MCDYFPVLVLDPNPGFAESALTPDDILAGRELAGRVVVYDDDHYYMANSLAVDLALKGHDVTIVTPMPTLAGWMGNTLEQPRMLQGLAETGIAMHPYSTAVGWEYGSLVVARSDTGEALPRIEGETLLSVTIREPETELSRELDARGVSHRLIGDAECPGPIQTAVYSGHRHARELPEQETGDLPFRRERPVLFDW